MKLFLLRKLDNDILQSTIAEAVEPYKRDAEIVRGMEALTNIGWAPELFYDDNGHWKVQCDTIDERGWSDSPRAAWDAFIEDVVGDDITALEVIDAARASSDAKLAEKEVEQ